MKKERQRTKNQIDEQESGKCREVPVLDWMVGCHAHYLFWFQTLANSSTCLKISELDNNEEQTGLKLQ